jgi:hypothetical protein
MKQTTEIQSRGQVAGAVTAATLIAGLLVLAAGSYGPNIALACLAAVALATGVACLWRPGEAPVLLFVFGYQWLQGSVAVFQATAAGKPVDEFFANGGEVAEATTLTLLALIAMAIGMRAVVGPVRRDLPQHAVMLAATRPMRDWFVLYASSWVLGAAALYAIGLASGLAQVLYGINALRWAFFLMLAFVHFSRERSAGWWFPAAFAFELAMGIGGYFSDFRTVFIVTFVAVVMAGVRLSIQRILAACIVAVAALAMGVVWTAIKPEYRQFVSGGAAAQIVTVGYPEQIQKLGELVADLDPEELGEATHELLSRLSYVELFGSTISHVPSVVPHEGGNLLLDAFVRPFMPRVFFPDKTEIDDSERTRYYTGLNVAGAEQGTSISLGWVAEMYIDFGRWGMMLGAVGIGLFYGLIQRTLTTWSRSQGLLGFAMASAVLISAAALESSITKVIGGLMASLIAAFLIIRFVVPVACPWVVRPPKPG